MNDQYVTRRELDARLAEAERNTRGWIATAIDESTKTQRREVETIVINLNGLVEDLSQQVTDTRHIADKAITAFEVMPTLIQQQLDAFGRTNSAQNDRIYKKLEEQEQAIKRFVSYERIARSGIVSAFRGVGALFTGGALVRWLRRLFEIAFILSITVIFFAGWYAALSAL